MMWSDMNDQQRERAIERLHAQNLSKKNIASKLKAREHNIIAFIAKNGMRLSPLNTTNHNDVTRGVAHGWWMEADTPQYRKFIVEQDLKFQKRFREVYKLDSDDVEHDPVPEERRQLFTKPVVEEYRPTPQDALNVIREAKRMLDENAANMNDVARGTKVLKEVAEKHNVSLVGMRGEGRNKFLVAARREAVFRLREECGYSYARIGNMLGGRDHTTAMHNYRKFILSADASA